MNGYFSGKSPISLHFQAQPTFLKDHSKRITPQIRIFEKVATDKDQTNLSRRHWILAKNTESNSIH